VIDTELQPSTIIDACGNFVSEVCELKYGVRPSWIINGEPSTRFAHVPVHLEYIITELLKNAFRAVVETGQERVPVVVTIAAVPGTPSSGLRDKTSVSTETEPKEEPAAGTIRPIDDSAAGVTIRIRDRGGGIAPDILPNIWSYSFTTFSEDDMPGYNGTIDALNVISNTGGECSSIAGLGYGLPLGRAYAEYFGGGIAVQSLWGWGTDVYLNLKGVGKIA
jgi:signal transduction histidine kinase